MSAAIDCLNGYRAPCPVGCGRCGLPYAQRPGAVTVGSYTGFAYAHTYFVYGPGLVTGHQAPKQYRTPRETAAALRRSLKRYAELIPA
jgi:hypothetical protein